MVDREGRDKADEVLDTLKSTWNVRHTNNSGADIDQNIQRSKNVLLQEEKHQDPHLKGLIDHIDKDKGAGEGKRMLRGLEKEETPAYLGNVMEK